MEHLGPEARPSWAVLNPKNIEKPYCRFFRVFANAGFRYFEALDGLSWAFLGHLGLVLGILGAFLGHYFLLTTRGLIRRASKASVRWSWWY